MARYRRTSSPPLAALAVSLLLVVLHCGAAARPLPPAPLVNHGASADNGLEGAADGLVLQKEGAAGNGDELSTSETVTEADEEATAPCGEEGNDDECMQRRLLRDAHLDYIYTQHKGKP